jgi:HK97 family phage major capsid protein/HK97 family phage prohead protease
MARKRGTKDYRSVIGKRQTRAFALEREMVKIDEEKRTVELSFASDAPIEHWFGTVILDHKDSSIRFDRLRSNGPLLDNHDPDKQIGTVRSATTDGTKTRGVVQFSRRQSAEDVFQDVKDDIIRSVSVGFIIHELVMEEKTDEAVVYRATDWEPIEISLVSVPADISVGVGRSMRRDDDAGTDGDPDEVDDEDPDEDEGRSEDCDDETRGGQEADDETDSERPRRAAHTPSIQVRTAMEKDKELLALGEMLNEVEMARDFIAEGKDIAAFRAAVLEKRQKAQTIVQKPLVELSDAEQRRYSICRAILADASGRPGYEGAQVTASFEVDVHQEIARKIGASKRGGIFIPTVVSREQLQRAGLDTKTATKGSEVVFTEPGDFIQMLRNKALVLALGARFLPGLQGPIAFPRQTGAGTFTWTGENSGSDVAESNLLLDQVTMSPKTGQSTTSFSRQLLTQSVIGVDQLVMDDLAQIAALEIDRVGIHGSGSSNQPRGVYATSGVGSVAFGGAISFGKVVDMETAIAGANGDIGVMAYLTTPNIRGTAKQTAKLSNTIAQALWEGGQMNGYRAEATNNVSKTLGTGSDHGIVFGVWDQLVVGEWGALEIITDPYAKKKQGMIEVTEFLMIDTALRQAAAFCKGTTLTP